jgi:hypothetical protein
LAQSQREFGEFFDGGVREIPRGRAVAQAAAHVVGVDVEAVAHVVEGGLAGFAEFGFGEDFEGPEFAGFWLHALQPAEITARIAAQKSAGAVAGAFYEELVEPRDGGVDAEGFGYVNPLWEAEDHAVEFAAVAACFAMPIGDVLPRNKLQSNTFAFKDGGGNLKFVAYKPLI